EGDRVRIAIDATDQVWCEEYGSEIRKALENKMSITIEITNVDEPVQNEKEPESEFEPELEAPVYISQSEALAIAFQHAGVDGAHAEIDEVELDSDDGVPYYEIEFEVGENEYEYEIHAISGEILDYDHDIEDDDN